jgi:hypothetical protein
LNGIGLSQGIDVHGIKYTADRLNMPEVRSKPTIQSLCCLVIVTDTLKCVVDSNFIKCPRVFMAVGYYTCSHAVLLVHTARI